MMLQQMLLTPCRRRIMIGTSISSNSSRSKSSSSSSSSSRLWMHTTTTTSSSIFSSSCIITTHTLSQLPPQPEPLPSSSSAIQMNRFQSTLCLPLPTLGIIVSAQSPKSYQIRSMASKKKGTGGGGGGDDGGDRGGDGDGGNNNIVKLQFCYSDYDLELMDDIDDDDDDGYLFQKVKFDMNDIKSKVEEMFDTSENLEYHDGKSWKPLKGLDGLAKYKGGKEPLKIRHPEQYDDPDTNVEGDDDDDDDEEEDYGRGSGKNKKKVGDYNDDMDDYDDYNPDDDMMGDEDEMYNRLNAGKKATVMEDTIHELVTLLKEQGYERSDVKATTMKETTTNKVIATKDWVLEQADKDPTFEAVLLGHVGSLDHIVQCLHYDMVWKPKVEEPTVVDDDQKNGDDDDEKDEHVKRITNK